MINVKDVVETHLPNVRGQKPLIMVLRKLLHEKEFHEFARRYPHLSGYDLIDQGLQFLDFSYQVRSQELENIPAQGRVMVVANHPLGSLDALCLIHLLKSVRPDVKIVGNRILGHIEPLRSMLFPMDNMTGKTTKSNIQDVRSHLNNDGAVVIFPAGVVSRFGWQGIRDGEWRRGFLSLAASTRSPILPVYVNARNSTFFYLLSLVARKISTLWLAHEMFKQRHGQLELRVGRQIKFDNYSHMRLDKGELAQLIKKHVYTIGRNRKGIFETEAPIAHPEDRRALRDEIKASPLLGITPDGKEIHLTAYVKDSCTMRELGRIREVTFRAVGEGTGKRRDLDHYDQDYMHLLLWDDDELELVGGYRFCAAGETIAQKGDKALYSSTIYEYLPAARPYLEQGLEFGRSFVQPRYWGSRSLDYLWYGIGTYIRQNPQYHYLFGAVSISSEYPQQAQAMLTVFYQQHFGGDGLQLVRPLYPYKADPQIEADCKALFPGDDYKTELRVLKDSLRNMGCAIPALFKQYTALAPPGGVYMLAPGLDVGFNNCIDNFVLVDTRKLYPSKYERYIGTASKRADPVSAGN